MAMSAIEIRELDRWLTDKPAGDAIVTIVDSGSASALDARSERILRDAVGNKGIADDIISTIETGAATSGRAAREIRRGMGTREGNTFITQLDALT